MSKFYSGLDFLVCKKEVTAGTPVALADADFDVQVIKDSIEFTPDVAIDDENSARATGEHKENDSVTGIVTATIAFNVRYNWGGAVNTSPNFNKLLHACGLKETSLTTTGIKFEPLASEDRETITIGYYQKEVASSPSYKEFIMAGCVGNVIIGAEGVGMPVIMQFTFTGKITTFGADQASPPTEDTANLDTAVPEKMLGTATTFNSVGICLTNFQLDSGNVVSPIQCQDDSRGIESHFISERHPRLTFDPQTNKQSILDNCGIWTAGTGVPFEIQFSPDSPAAGDSHLKIIAPVCQILTKAEAEAEGLRTEDINLKVRGNDSFETNYDSNLDDNTTFQLLIGNYT